MAITKTPKRVGFFILPGEEKRIEDILNNPDYVIIKQKENFAVKEGVLMIYMEYEDNSTPEDNTSYDEEY